MLAFAAAWLDWRSANSLSWHDREELLFSNLATSFYCTPSQCYCEIEHVVAAQFSSSLRLESLRSVNPWRRRCERHWLFLQDAHPGALEAPIRACAEPQSMRREEQEEPTETDGVKKNLLWASKPFCGMLTGLMQLLSLAVGGDQTIESLQELMENAEFATIDRSISMLQAHRTQGAVACFSCPVWRRKEWSGAINHPSAERRRCAWESLTLKVYFHG